MAIGPWQIIIIVLAIIILFGGKKIPEIARGLGLGLKEFKKATKEIKNEVKNAADTISDDKSD
ncbi:MAG: twin-arginine translocase TatA/TatE family subunit [Candidatus Neomarinimicrobiota bacterium]|nr:twin-arginine translocase TatA/TatE family subunit [Candidatus Neomarinimicrobiota bacterium]|tara:strand:- start:864 stop:1052 length:189 start_codon:yes stop_codon:yes gene_type:complete